MADLKPVIDRFHAEGIIVGMQPYAFFMAKTCPWVTPVPDPRLASDAVFTLSAELPVGAADVPVDESTADMSTITGFFVRNSITLRIEEELITYSGATKEAPFTFTGCTRGAYGTTASAHPKGARAYHLKECFGLFVPDPETTLFEEVAAKTAELVNEAGFDGIYLDALDGEDVLGGWQNSWHYGTRYVFEIWKRLNRPTIMEASTFHHHLWFVRSRMGAWDHPSRSHRAFIDMHVRGNESSSRMFLPGNLGWWAFKMWGGSQTEPTFPEDIEYLCAKAIGTGSGLSCTTFDAGSPGHQRLAAITRQYEALRHADYFPEDVKAKLAVLGDDYTLEEAGEGEWRLRPAEYARHKVTGQADGSESWQVANAFGEQMPGLRIEGLNSAGAYDAEANPTVTDFATAEGWASQAAGGVSIDLAPSTEQVKAGAVSGKLTASSTLDKRRGAWASVTHKFDPPLDLSAHPFLGLWVYGDGKGEVLNVQLKSPSHLSHGVADHYIPIDFEGWRYVEIIEPEGERHADYAWPYGGSYAMYRELIRFNAVETLAVYLNELPPGEDVCLYLSPARGVSAQEAPVSNPSITIGGKTLTFPVDIPTGSYLEFRAMDDCKLYGRNGEVVSEVTPTGDAPTLAAGENTVAFGSAEPSRARVTVMTKGEPL